MPCNHCASHSTARRNGSSKPCAEKESSYWWLLWQTAKRKRIPIFNLPTEQCFHRILLQTLACLECRADHSGLTRLNPNHYSCACNPGKRIVAQTAAAASNCWQTSGGAHSDAHTTPPLTSNARPGNTTALPAPSVTFPPDSITHITPHA